MSQREKAVPKHTNQLVHETSPYLLQHAHNPVNWFPWGEEALAKAKAENKPIFLSIGYSACHWCHVMEVESFENETIAEVMNRHFVNIKVDREERPDLDEIYMSAVQILTHSGGWPMSVFLTPDLKPFYGGTYFPPDERFGRPGFKTILLTVAQAWEEKRDEILKSAEQLTGFIQQSMSARMTDGGELNASLLANATEELAQNFDPAYGGFGDAPKFPSAPSIALLLRQYAHTGNAKLLDMVALTLTKMAYGGIYDQLGGGFHRYSVDAQWLVPHFEKMLYDNAQLAQVYLEAYQATQKPLYRRVATETLDYAVREMTDAGGAFHSTEDADSERQEGKFYLWTQDEIVNVLGPEDGHAFCAYYGVRARGNFASHEAYHEGQNILHVPRSPEAAAKDLGLGPEVLEDKVRAARARLMVVREKRVRPGRDDKILTSWNGLMISALAQGYQVIGEERWRAAAERAADFILKEMVRDGVLLRTYREGRARHAGYLDDYAFFAAACVDLYEATFDLRWLDAADDLCRKMITAFWDAADGGFFFTGADHKSLIARSKPTYDGSEPSGNAVAAAVLLKLAKLTDNRDYLGKAEQILKKNARNMSEAPQACLKMLCAADFYLNAPKEIAIVGPRDSDAVRSLLRTLHGQFLPNKVVACLDPSDGDPARVVKRVPLLAGKTLVNGQAAAYVCKDFACERPVAAPDALLQVLSARKTEIVSN